MKFRTIEEFYEHESQAFQLAPPFAELADSAKQHWVAEFEKYRAERAAIEKKRAERRGAGQ